MTIYNNLQKVALFIFVGAITIFLMIPFIGTYQLNENKLNELVMNNTLNASVAEALIATQSNEAFNETSTTIGFNAELNKRFDMINQSVASKYAFSDGYIDEIIKETSGKFQLDFVAVEQKQANLDPTVDQFLKETLISYSGWMKDRDFDTKDRLLGNLNGTVSSIGNSAIEKNGIAEGKMSDLKITLTKFSSIGGLKENMGLLLFLTIGLGTLSGLFYVLLGYKTKGHAGIKNDGIMFNSMTSLKWLGMVTGTFLILFYVALYWFPQTIAPWIAMVDPVSAAISGNPASQWFLYGFLYTISIIVMGIRMIIKYRHSPYQIVRTISVMFFQTTFAFLIPEILVKLNQPYYDFKNMWPLDYDFFDAWHIKQLTADGGSVGIFMFAWGMSLFLIGVPLFTYLFGKRWYCSWVCGCGGLAETLGDPYRQLSDKSMKAWKIERWMIHSVLVFAVVMTGMVLYTFFTEQSQIFGIDTYGVRKTYGFMIGSAFSGVIGTGFYPLMGNRTWCRFGCPLAAYLGIVQRFKSRFRITTNGGQCISCGNCSTYCEMGIDVRSYAQKGQNIVRSSCVGCGVCSAVCPRGVLNLEVKSGKGRLDPSALVSQ